MAGFRPVNRPPDGLVTVDVAFAPPLGGWAVKVYCIGESSEEARLGCQHERMLACVRLSSHAALPTVRAMHHHSRVPSTPKALVPPA